MIGQASIDLVIESEVTSRAMYEKLYHFPEWPQGASGITIGIGYDLGYATEAKMRADWTGLLAPTMLDVMARCVGMTGEAAANMLPSVKHLIDVPWDAAVHVFMNRDVPEYVGQVLQHIPEAAKLSPNCLGVLFSLDYNRGACWDDQRDRCREMRAIKAHIQSGNLAAVEQDIRDMKRVWAGLPGMRGLLARRDAEADLWRRGLSETAQATPPRPVASENPAKVLPPQTPSKTAPVVVAGGATVVAVGTAAGVTGGGQISYGWAILAAAAVVAVVAIFIAIRRHQNQVPTVARQKDIAT